MRYFKFTTKSSRKKKQNFFPLTRTLFDVEQFNKKVLLSKLVGYVCQNQMGTEMATNALRILSEFNETNPAEMEKNALQLLVSGEEWRVIWNCWNI